MNEKQTKILDAYTNLLLSVLHLPQNEDQEIFCNNLSKVGEGLRNLSQLQGRGREQWIYNMALSDKEWDEVRTEIGKVVLQNLRQLYSPEDYLGSAERGAKLKALGFEEPTKEQLAQNLLVNFGVVK